MKTVILGLLLTTIVSASENDLSHRPKAFAYNTGKAVFADFTNANYEVTYDLKQEKAFAKASIQFETLEAGFPIFDAVTAPTSIKLDGKTVTASLVKTPNNETTVRVVEQKTEAGTHLLQIELPLTELVEFKSEGVKSAFWTSDLDERNFMELFLPANFEFDQVKMSLVVRFVGLKKEQSIYTNGLVQKLDNETYRIEYPEYYTASSIFFHTVPKGTVDELQFKVKSIDGRILPAVAYTSKGTWATSMDRVKERVTAIIAELERDYGAFPHPSITVYIAGAGGMEYCGATMTDVTSMGHELFHSYFARGVMPANGNSGWLDEALASWRDDGYPTLTSLSGTSGMSSHPYYTRITDQAAYSFGERFMSLLDGKTKANGGLKPFMRYMVATHTFKPIFVEEFIQELGNFYKMSFVEDFKRYTFKNGAAKTSVDESSPSIHHKMSVQELKQYL